MSHNGKHDYSLSGGVFHNPFKHLGRSFCESLKLLTIFSKRSMLDILLSSKSFTFLNLSLDIENYPRKDESNLL